MKADIFIPTSNRINALNNCLTSLNNQTDKKFNVFLVGLKKDKDVEKLVASFKNLKIDYFLQKKPGIIGAANEALKKTKGEIFIRTDDDVILDKGWFKNLIQTYQEDKMVGGVTGPTIMNKKGIESRDLTAFLNNFKKSQNLFSKLLNLIYYRYIYEGKIKEVSIFLKSGAFSLGSNFSDCLKIKNIIQVDGLEACNWSCRTKLLKSLGGFDEIYLKGIGDCHESDIPFKIKKLGYKIVFNPKAKLEHHVEIGKVQKARPASFYRIQNFIIFYHRYFPIKSFDQLLRFKVNLLMQNGYYFYRFLTTGNFSQLGAIPGTIVGLFRAYILKV